jgi:hypothetical protein
MADYHREFHEAKETLDLSGRTASEFVAQLGALAPILVFPLPNATLGRRPGFQATVLDQKYWFAKLYEIVSYEELNYSTHTDNPGFSLHFMKVFYAKYYRALRNYQKGAFAVVPSLWKTHFDTRTGDGTDPEPASMAAVQFSVRTGAIAHIQGDMAKALVEAYQTWQPSPKPEFNSLKGDFIEKSEKAFTKAQARFYLDVNDKTASPFSPAVGQLGAAYYQQLFDIQPSLSVMFQWRREAWEKAAAEIN